MNIMRNTMVKVTQESYQGKIYIYMDELPLSLMYLMLLVLIGYIKKLGMMKKSLNSLEKRGVSILILN